MTSAFAWKPTRSQPRARYGLHNITTIQHFPLCWTCFLSYFVLTFNKKSSVFKEVSLIKSNCAVALRHLVGEWRGAGCAFLPSSQFTVNAAPYKLSLCMLVWVSFGNGYKVWRAFCFLAKCCSVIIYMRGVRLSSSVKLSLHTPRVWDAYNVHLWTQWVPFNQICDVNHL